MLYICDVNYLVMESLRLEFQPEIKAKILELLSSFSSDELKIVQEGPDFDQVKWMLNARVEKIKSGTAQFCSFEALDKMLEETISKYEN